MSNKEQLEKNILYMQKSIPPDDIYMFAELNYDACTYLLNMLFNIGDIDEMMEEDPLFNRIVNNVVSYHGARKHNKEIFLDLGTYDSD